MIFMWPQNWTVPLFSVSHFCLSLETTWRVVLTLCVSKDIDLMLACSAKAEVVASPAASKATVATVLRKAWLTEDISLS
ncbi:hypothetical protein AJ88_33020 [Mesorhizobium amorphae CCBAU 01583]|nr:hypothetical protein AJ88_33020 [Mesorhizobium amorphae CCBAU 01583]